MAIPTTHSDDPNRIRREVVERLLDVTNARSGLYHETTEVDGVRFYVKVTAPGPAVYQSIVDGLEGTRLRIGAAATCGRRVEHARREAWSIHNPSRLNTRTFCLLRDDIILERFRELPVWTELYEPAQITTDQLRVLIFQEGRHVGWLGVFRATGESRFDVVHRARANRERAELQRQ